MKIAFLSLGVLFAASFLVSCARPENVQNRMQRQEVWDIRAESFDRRMNQMSANADERYYSKITGEDTSDSW